jgi:hypothetical protein
MGAPVRSWLPEHVAITVISRSIATPWPHTRRRRRRRRRRRCDAALAAALRARGGGRVPGPRHGQRVRGSPRARRSRRCPVAHAAAAAAAAAVTAAATTASTMVGEQQPDGARRGGDAWTMAETRGIRSRDPLPGWQQHAQKTPPVTVPVRTRSSTADVSTPCACSHGRPQHRNLFKQLLVSRSVWHADRQQAGRVVAQQCAIAVRGHQPGQDPPRALLGLLPGSDSPLDLSSCDAARACADSRH